MTFDGDYVALAVWLEQADGAGTSITSAGRSRGMADTLGQ